MDSRSTRERRLDSAVDRRLAHLAAACAARGVSSSWLVAENIEAGVVTSLRPLAPVDITDDRGTSAAPLESISALERRLLALVRA